MHRLREPNDERMFQPRRQDSFLAAGMGFPRCARRCQRTGEPQNISSGLLTTGRQGAGKPLGGLGRRGRWAALWLITCLTVVQSGCQSGPFSNCGSGSGLLSPCGFFGRLSARVFNRSNGGCCSSGVVTDAPVEYAGPAAVVTPGAIPTYPSGPASSSTPSSVFPAPTNAPSDSLDPIPKSKVVPPPANGASTPRRPPNRVIKRVAPISDRGLRGNETTT